MSKRVISVKSMMMVVSDSIVCPFGRRMKGGSVAW